MGKVNLGPLFAFAAVQLGVCFVAALTLFSIWLRGFENDQHQHTKDTGIGFLVLGCTTWAYVGTLQLAYGPDDPAGIFRPLLSVINSLAFCGAVAYFDVVVASKDPIGRFLVRVFHPVHKVWMGIGVGIASYILLVAIKPWNTYLDVLLSLVAILLLLYALCYSFWHRGFRALAIVAGIILVAELAAQIPELPNQNPCLLSNFSLVAVSTQRPLATARSDQDDAVHALHRSSF